MLAAHLLRTEEAEQHVGQGSVRGMPEVANQIGQHSRAGQRAVEDREDGGPDFRVGLQRLQLSAEGAPPLEGIGVADTAERRVHRHHEDGRVRGQLGPNLCCRAVERPRRLLAGP